MELLPIYLFIAALFEVLAIYKLYQTKNANKVIPTGLFGDEVVAKDESVLVFTAIFLLILIVNRIHCALDIHSKSIYRLTIWIHILEALVLVVFPLFKKRLNSNAYPIAFLIVMLPVWMTISYKYYLY
jgi:hypothetical protein